MKVLKNLKTKLKSLSYIEVLISMVIIGFVFTAFLNMTYKAVHRAKVLEQEGLMENYAVILLERFNTIMQQQTSWTPGTYIINTDNTLSPINDCELQGNFLAPSCYPVGSILTEDTGSPFSYIIVANPDTNVGGSNAVYKITVTVACQNLSSGKTSCNGDELRPITLTRYIVSYGTI